MTILEIFEKVNLIIPIEQRTFFNFFEDTVNELQSLYRDFVFIKDLKEKQTQDTSNNYSISSSGDWYINGILAEENNDKGEQQNTNVLVKEYTPPTSLSNDNVVLPLYHNSIVDNILFLANAGETYKSEFIRKSKDAYLKYWNDNAQGRRRRRMRW